MKRAIIALCLAGLLIVPTLAVGSASKFDQVTLKNGDVITGEVLTKVFKLRIPPSLKLRLFKAEDVKAINFESKTYRFKIGSHELDVFTLKTGERFSGFVQNDVIHFKLRSGESMLLRKGDMKAIIFKE